MSKTEKLGHMKKAWREKYSFQKEDFQHETLLNFLCFDAIF